MTEEEAINKVRSLQKEIRDTRSKILRTFNEEWNPRLHNCCIENGGHFWSEPYFCKMVIGYVMEKRCKACDDTEVTERHQD